MDILKVIDPDERQLEELNNKKNIFELSNNKLFKYKDTNTGIYYQVIHYKHAIKFWSFITIFCDDLLYMSKIKNNNFGYLIFFDNDLYYWNFNQNELMLSFGESFKFKEAHVFTKHLKEF